MSLEGVDVAEEADRDDDGHIPVGRSRSLSFTNWCACLQSLECRRRFKSRRGCEETRMPHGGPVRRVKLRGNVKRLNQYIGSNDLAASRLVTKRRAGELVRPLSRIPNTTFESINRITLLLWTLVLRSALCKATTTARISTTSGRGLIATGDR